VTIYSALSPNLSKAVMEPAICSSGTAKYQDPKIAPGKVAAMYLVWTSLAISLSGKYLII
jgi:hypothetical protein